MATELSIQDLHFILESLTYSKIKFEAYDYLTHELKLQKLKETDKVISKVQGLIKEM